MSTAYKSKTAQQGFGRGPRRGTAVEKPADLKTSLKRLLAYFAKEKKYVVLMVLVSVAGVLGSVIAPSFQSSAIDSIVSGTFDKLPHYLLCMIVSYLIYGFCTLIQGFVSSMLSQRVVKAMRKDLFDRIVSLPISYLDSHSHGDIMSRMTNDADNISSVISSALASLFTGVLTLIGTIVMMLRYSVSLTLLSCSTIVLTVFVTGIISKKMAVYFSRRQILLGNLNGIIEEKITASHTVAAYSQEESVIEDFSKTADELTKTGIIAEIIGGSMGPIMNTLNNISFVIVAVFGAYFALKGYISVGVISAFTVYSKQFSRPINEIAQLYGQIETALAGAERIFAILDVQPEDMSGDDVEHTNGVIEFKHVNFSYVPEKKVIDDFSLKIESGKKIALVGSTGSGKTTIINLLMRFYDIDSGEILLDGKDISTISRKSLRDLIGIVLQDTVLFSDTVRNNLSYAMDDVSDEELNEAAEFASVKDMIENMPEGYDTVLTESGSGISQGQRQLLAIGRAYLSNPEILILDEATSSVDTRTEKNIQDAMVRLMKDRTSLIIAHRLSTIQDADAIIVMDHGKIVEMGNHMELLKKQGRYYDLYMTQFAGGQI